MKQGLTNYYLPEFLWKIMNGEERRGKLREDYYSSDVQELSSNLKVLREEYSKLPKVSRPEKLQEIQDLKNQLDDLKKIEIRHKAELISSGKVNLAIDVKQIKGHSAYIANNVETMLISQIIKFELRRSYKLYPANMDVIIEQVKGLLDNSMPKVIIRADIHHFFESIPQHDLVQTLLDDGFVSRQSIKYLKGILYAYNEKANNIQAIGVPRGLAFSSHLSEFYMSSIDEKIQQIDGIYYYKRYVDDIIIVADPSKHSIGEYWVCLKDIIQEKGLDLHEDSYKKYIQVLDGDTTGITFDYLGYRFTYHRGMLNLGLSQKRYLKYQILLDTVFDIYNKCSHYRKPKSRLVEDGKSKYEKRDALHQLIDRLDVLTSNGLLSGRKNFVTTGIYYSNKYLTDFGQLTRLDIYLQEKIENCFNPPANLFNYGEDNGHDKNVILIKQKLHSFSFVKGYEKRKLHKNAHFGHVLLELQHIYRAYINKELS